MQCACLHQPQKAAVCAGCTHGGVVFAIYAVQQVAAGVGGFPFLEVTERAKHDSQSVTPSCQTGRLLTLSAFTPEQACG